MGVGVDVGAGVEVGDGTQDTVGLGVKVEVGGVKVGVGDPESLPLKIRFITPKIIKKKTTPIIIPPETIAFWYD